MENISWAACFACVLGSLPWWPSSCLQYKDVMLCFLVNAHHHVNASHLLSWNSLSPSFVFRLVMNSLTSFREQDVLLLYDMEETSQQNSSTTNSWVSNVIKDFDSLWFPENIVVECSLQGKSQLLGDHWLYGFLQLGLIPRCYLREYSWSFCIYFFLDEEPQQKVLTMRAY